MQQKTLLLSCTLNSFYENRLPSGSFQSELLSFSSIKKELKHSARRACCNLRNARERKIQLKLDGFSRLRSHNFSYIKCVCNMRNCAGIWLIVHGTTYDIVWYLSLSEYFSNEICSYSKWKQQHYVPYWIRAFRVPMNVTKTYINAFIFWCEFAHISRYMVQIWMWNCIRSRSKMLFVVQEISNLFFPVVARKVYSLCAFIGQWTNLNFNTQLL